MRFSFIKKMTCILVLFFLIKESAQASKHSFFEDEQQTQQLCPFTHPDIVPQIFSLLDDNDISTISLVCTKWHCATDLYSQYILEPFLKNPFEDAPDTSNIFSNIFIVKAMQQRLRQQGFLAIPRRSILVSSLNYNFHSLNTEDLQNHLDVSARLYMALFNESLVCEEENTPTHLQHLLAAIPVAGIFLDKDQRAFGCTNFFKCFTEILENKLKDMAKARPYWSFTSTISGDLKEKLKATSHVLVITDDELSKPKNKETLQSLLSSHFTSKLDEHSTAQNAHKSHAILLDINTSPFVQEGVLHLCQDSMPLTTSELILTNRTSNIHSLGDGFLKDMPCLQILNLHSFINLTHIGNDTLKGNWFLRVFRIEDTPNVTHIKNNFLYNCQRLPELDLSHFKKVINIEDSFMRNCTVFHKMNIKDLENILHIGPWSFENNLLTQEKKEEIKEYFRTRNITWQG